MVVCVARYVFSFSFVICNNPGTDKLPVSNLCGIIYHSLGSSREFL